MAFSHSTIRIEREATSSGRRPSPPAAHAPRHRSDYADFGRSRSATGCQLLTSTSPRREAGIGASPPATSGRTSCLPHGDIEPPRFRYGRSGDRDHRAAVASILGQSLRQFGMRFQSIDMPTIAPGIKRIDALVRADWRTPPCCRRSGISRICRPLKVLGQPETNPGDEFFASEPEMILWRSLRPESQGNLPEPLTVRTACAPSCPRDTVENRLRSC